MPTKSPVDDDHVLIEVHDSGRQWKALGEMTGMVIRRPAEADASAKNQAEYEFTLYLRVPDSATAEVRNLSDPIVRLADVDPQSGRPPRVTVTGGPLARKTGTIVEAAARITCLSSIRQGYPTRAEVTLTFRAD